jgi:putative ABC transport system ATP-binding protein
MSAASTTSRAAPQDARRAAIELTDVIRVFREVDVETVALRGVSLRIGAGELVAIMGRSGSGKSTLLHLIAGSDRPTAGRVEVEGVDLGRAEEAERARIRGARVGIVFQRENLVPFLTVRENIDLITRLAGRTLDHGAIDDLLRRVGLDARADHRPSQLSGGEQQRAALAAVVATRAPIVLGDEITGELDTANAGLLLDLLLDLHAAEGITVVLATHDPAVAARAGRVVQLRDGRIVEDGRPS